MRMSWSKVWKLFAWSAIFFTVVAVEASSKGMAFRPEQATVPVTDVYVPTGLDSESEAFVVVNGYFPNTCYKSQVAEVQEHASTLHDIRVVAEVSPGMCAMILVPYAQEVSLGRLERGVHTLRFANPDGTILERELVIEK